MANFNLSIITPNGKFFDDKVDVVSAPGSNGSVGILAQHAPFVTTLKEGIIKVKANNAEIFFAVQSGILEVNVKHDVLVLVDYAVKAESEIRAKELAGNFAAR